MPHNNRSTLSQALAAVHQLSLARLDRGYRTIRHYAPIDPNTGYRRRRASLVWTTFDYDGTPRREHDAERLDNWIFARTGRRPCHICGEPDRDSCECVECESCGHRCDSDHMCRSCDRCRDCCSCPRCSECGTVCDDSDSLCGSCECCNECCNCGGITNVRCDVRSRHGEPSQVFPRYIGVEIECGWDSNANGPSRALEGVVRKWKGGIDHDGSIDCGRVQREITTSPSRGDSFIRQVDEVCGRLADLGARVDASCGLHVHIDAKDMTWSQILGVARLYTFLEPALYSMLPESRSTGHYAKPWGDAFHKAEVFDGSTVQEREDRLGAAMYGTIDEYKRMKRSPYKHEARYHGLNFNSLLLYGTLEFRLHSGTVDAAKIKNWAAICSAIVGWGKKHGEKVLRNMDGSPWQVLEKIILSMTGAMPVVQYARARRDKFQARKRQNLGMAAPAPSPAVGVEEGSEVIRNRNNW